MTYKRTFSLSLRLVEEVEIDIDETPSLPPMPVVETTGHTVSEVTRPLAKCPTSNVPPFKRAV